MQKKHRTRFEIPHQEWTDLVTAFPRRPLADVLRQIYRIGYKAMTGKESSVVETGEASGQARDEDGRFE